MPEVGAGVGLVDVRGAGGIEGGVVIAPFDVTHVQHAVGGEDHAVSGVSCGHDAVEHVDTAGDGLQDIPWGANPHEVSGARGGEESVQVLHDGVHRFGGFAHGEAADGVAVGVEVGGEFRRFFS